MARARTTTPRIPDDARAQRSLEALRAALLALVETTPLEQITIRAITDAAGVSYPTFFRRYAGKEELLADVAAAEVRRLLALVEAAMTGGPGHSAAAPLCRAVAERRPLWRALLTGGAAGAVRAEFMQLSREMARQHPRANPWLPVELAVAFVTGGILEILAWWMRQPDDYPIANVIALFDALIVDTTARPRAIALEPWPEPERD